MAREKCPSLLKRVEETATRFNNALCLFSKCHLGYNSGVVTDTEIDDLGKNKGVLTHCMCGCCFFSMIIVFMQQSPCLKTARLSILPSTIKDCFTSITLRYFSALYTLLAMNFFC